MRKCCNDSDRNTKNRNKSRSRSTRRSPRFLEKELEKEQAALGIRVLLQTDLLPWRDAMALGSTCKIAQETWMMTRDVHMLPLLNVLDNMFGEADEKVGDKVSLRDIFLDDDYENFSIARKCEDLAVNIGSMVSNMRSHRFFCLDNPSNRLENTECDPGQSCNWEVGSDYETETRFLHKFHRRGTLAINIAIFDYALGSAMKEGRCGGYFKDVFMGLECAHLGRDCGYEIDLCHEISSMFPFRDKDLAKQMRHLYPSSSVLELLGPALTKRVVLAEPFFRFLPPLSDDEVNGASGNNEEDVAPLFQNLPTPLEPLTEEIIIENGMGNWLDPNYKVDFHPETTGHSP